MAKIEGVRRIMITGKVIALVGSAFAVLTWILLYSIMEGRIALIMLLGWLSYPLALGGLVWAAGWITQGFLHPDA